MIFVTGDTHIPIDIQKLNTKCFKQQLQLTKKDYVIICGDFGGIWNDSNEEKYWLKWIKNKNFTTLFVDGNHENFTRLKHFPIVDFCESKARKIDEGIFHLLRGNIYTIEGKTFFTFGGASSHDKNYRTENINWWKEELPSQTEYNNALNNLEKFNWRVDYVITHCAATSIQTDISSDYESDELTHFFEMLQNKLKYRAWYFGHYHKDKLIQEKNHALFNTITQII